ncbi:tRNA lysidine(34) synthetase TilS [Sphingomonas sp. FW199]|uniref:tRNA lysidine(34) synthetase TilS n=1 Tax=Sphingomonas sp. FW199 TaxID=3400217 RepID=UPI003CF71936
MPSALPSELVARFHADALALLPHPPTTAAPLALAVSGGADSMAMLALAHAAFPDAVIAATVDHGLRAGSADEAQMVADHCAVPGVPHEILALTGLARGPAVQERARTARYTALGEWAARHGALALATAHQADDQAETLLMRAARGVGLTGMRGIPAIGMAQGLPVIRPLLGWTRADLRALCLAHAIPFADDPGNADPAYERVRVRAMLGRQEWLDPRMLARTADRLAQADGALDWVAERLWTERASAGPDGGVTLAAGDLPRDLARRLVRRAIHRVRADAGIDSPGFADTADIEPLLDALTGGGGASHGGVMARATGENWQFRPAPPRRLP